MKSTKASTQNLVPTRPPVVTVMGHVDHGKTSILDFLRKANVAAKEFGGITQHTSAYQITKDSRKITFIDTPGHAAFSEMRSRGGKVADIVILVVSVPDGVQPQTIEAIGHAKGAKVPIIVALNKIDAPGAKENLDKVKGQLAEAGILLESYGGDVVSVETSAKTGEGMPALLDMILLVADMAELKYDPAAPFSGVTLESRLDTKKGLLALVIAREGSLKSGQKVYAEGIESKIRALLNERGEVVQEVLAGDPVTILGFVALPVVGAIISSVAGSASAAVKTKPTVVANIAGVTTVHVILKSDTEGTLEAISGSLKKLQKPDRVVDILSQSVGDITDSDVLLSSGSDALILAFNTKVTASAEAKAIDFHVTIKTYSIIYEMLEDMEKILATASLPAEDTVRGRAEVIALFPLPSGDIVAGCKVSKGRLKVGEKIRLLRVATSPDPIYIGRIRNIKEGKTEVELITAGKDCGLLLKPAFPDLKKGDVVEVA